MGVRVLDPTVLILDEELPGGVAGLRLASEPENAMPPYCGVMVTVPVEAVQAEVARLL